MIRKSNIIPKIKPKARCHSNRVRSKDVTKARRKEVAIIQ
jgi:hypothetical protein